MVVWLALPPIGVGEADQGWGQPERRALGGWMAGSVSDQSGGADWGWNWLWEVPQAYQEGGGSSSVEDSQGEGPQAVDWLVLLLLGVGGLIWGEVGLGEKLQEVTYWCKGGDNWGWG